MYIYGLVLQLKKKVKVNVLYFAAGHASKNPQTKSFLVSRWRAIKTEATTLINFTLYVLFSLTLYSIRRKMHNVKSNIKRYLTLLDARHEGVVPHFISREAKIQLICICIFHTQLLSTYKTIS